ncbi:MAG: AmmeMemoRadiSam system radical SAM enzyme [Candidatus Omnitrophica bacterium]|nr:AmmeMemoRadiSam system radical SAM enzyme [Candidatus Omnitrophota bacterium]
MKKVAMLYEKLETDLVHCFLCSHRCKIADSQYGFCGVRKNEKGVLYSFVYADVIASHVDPIEKKPLYHFLPGSSAYSIATIGCNFRCSFCQNWQISQLSKRNGLSEGYELKPEEVVREAKKYSCKGIAYTYTEPTIFFEYAYDTARIARKNDLYNIFVTNGYMTKKALDKIKPYLDAANVDLKSFSDDTYRTVCSGSLQPVLDSIRYMKELGIWVEVTTLIIPRMNDSDKELNDIAEFIVGVSSDIPWHISRYHPDYKYIETPATPLAALKKAESIGKRAGLKYVYLGNTGEECNTYCAGCGCALVKRRGYDVSLGNIDNNKCSKCGTDVSGIW